MSKYKAKKCVIDGIKFDSLKEGRRYRALKLLERAGEVQNLELQPRYDLIVNGVNPYVTLPVAFLAGALAGIATALIATQLHIHSLLASILVTTALITINLRIMGRSNIPLLNSEDIFTPFAGPFKQFISEQRLTGLTLKK